MEIGRALNKPDGIRAGRPVLDCAADFTVCDRHRKLLPTGVIGLRRLAVELKRKSGWRTRHTSRDASQLEIRVDLDINCQTHNGIPAVAYKTCHQKVGIAD